jgi:DsbC/DsbD-like thiol-disulfide interchange protein
MRMFVLIAAFLGSVVPVAAAATAWQEVEPGTRIRLITSGELSAAGTTMVGIELDMPANTKTYWRVPGETGIPASLDLSGSSGVAAHRVLWPYPEIDAAAGFTDFVYYGPTVLPIELTVTTESPLLQADMVLGICSDICIPVQVTFDWPLDFTAPDSGQSLRLRQALALAPIAWEDDQPALGEVTFDRAAGALVVPLGHPDVDPLSVIADAGADGPLFGAPQKSPDGRLIRLPLLGDEGDAGLGGRAIQFTFMTRMGPFEITRHVTPLD